ncbi:cadherin-13-like isoform X4 [Epinephelus fuscoguttatus]|uniref:cadherin-13-like isoform X4 n=1 Tax=Epinephelus fuscoguttatus TaxID=293821 RepID=UPI0020D10DC1|nr:cadherin-13-like isoform X4 [Epinephelus fuscoguttatus]
METIHFVFFLMMCLGVHRSSSEILNRQKRNWIIDSYSIDEDYKGEFPYILGKIAVEKKLTFFKIHGQGVDEEPKGIFQIDENTGVIRVYGPVDYERYRVLKLTFQALDREKHVIDTRLGVEILINDANDNPPKFGHDVYQISIPEATSQGTILTTVMAKDDDSEEDNRLFDLNIISVTPQPSDLEFYLTQNFQIGAISFKGCLDHEKAEKYTIIVEAKDHGKKKQLSSSCTVIINIADGNNHIPQIIGQTGPGRVKEGQTGVLVLRLQVTDADSKGTPAWRAKYKILGDQDDNFNITTDPETNEGLLYVKKHLNYEDSSLRTLTISVENEIPYHTCKVVSRSSSLWKVETIGGETVTETTRLSTRQVTVTVEDVNEAPIFKPPNKMVSVAENGDVGQYLWTFTAKDPDTTNTVVYRKGDDPAGWITVDTKTGKITTTKIIDRESSFVKNNIYTVTILAVDNGQPLMTGTATLTICVSDKNDNAPFLPVGTIDMCQSDGLSLANITAMDLDEHPYSGPFTFKLQGNEKGYWKLDPTRGYSVNLVKENTVHSGHYELLLEMSDLQGNTAVHNLSVTVCNCMDPARPNCRVRKAAGSTFGGGAVGILFLGILLLAGVLLLVFLMSCKREKIPIPDGDSGQHLMNSNTEEKGTDCKVAFEPLNNYIQNEKQTQVMSQLPAMNQIGSTKQQNFSRGNSMRWSGSTKQQNFSRGNSMRWSGSTKQQNFSRGNSMRWSGSTKQQNFSRGNSMRWSMGASSAMGMRHEHRNSMRGTWAGHSRYFGDLENAVQRTVLLNALNKMLSAQQAPGEELGDYAPHVYAEEGDTKTNSEFDAISISDTPFDVDLDLDHKFTTLATVCMPTESTAFRTTTHGTATLLQKEHSAVINRNL